MDQSDTAAAANARQYVCFRLNDQEFGINIENVLEVINRPPVTPVINTPSFISGVINLRGQIIAVVDLKIFFGLVRGKKAGDQKIVVGRIDGRAAGFLVDAISQLRACAAPAADSIPATVTGKTAEFLGGVVNIFGRPLMVINLHSIYNSDDFKQFE